MHDGECQMLQFDWFICACIISRGGIMPIYEFATMYHLTVTKAAPGLSKPTYNKNLDVHSFQCWIYQTQVKVLMARYLVSMWFGRIIKYIYFWHLLCKGITAVIQ